MESFQLQKSLEVATASNIDSSINSYVSLETEMPEALYKGINEFISNNPKWDQYEVMSSALANFLFQNGCSDRAVTEKYLNDLFNLSES